ncbi:DUF2920 family protein [Planomicrobium okeanokoites]|uniref:DUF2920 family protein n=1 Tax=Planomicrobium okeanokoites TaxID=244 RepID=UPI000A02FD39|nr:DUF2920 family protein [Planomicrobium okeanokoites]
MAKDYKINLPAHPNIYSNDEARDFNIYFSEPDEEVNKETGLLLLIPGFGGDANSNVYKKMRADFADKYNLVTVQCDYFGQEFMQDTKSLKLNIDKDFLYQNLSSGEYNQIYGKSFNVNKFLEIGSKYKINVSGKEEISETATNYNDMGIMQAIDNLTALHYVVKIIEDNNFEFNTKKIIVFGQSHGAYLSYLCNALSPGLFSLIIDNSSWLFPQYLTSSRFLTRQYGEMKIQIEFDYHARKLEYDDEFLNLVSLYSKFENKCVIEVYHGTEDKLISSEQKEDFCREIKSCMYNEISSENIDGEIFKSAGHGLQADFIKLFDKVINNHAFEFSTVMNLKDSVIATSKYNYQVNYKNGVPILTTQVK